MLGIRAATYFNILGHIHGVLAFTNIGLWFMYDVEKFLFFAIANFIFLVQCRIVQRK